MKIKAAELVNSVAILREVDMTKMKLSTSYKIRKILDEAQTVATDFEERRIALAKSLGELNKKQNRYLFPTKEAEQEFQNKMQDLLDEELDINIEPIPVELVDDHIAIEPCNISAVSWMISGLEE